LKILVIDFRSRIFGFMTLW